MTEKSKFEIAIAILMGIFFLLFYVAPSWIAFRNTKFRMSLRVLFSFTAAPLFLVLMTINYFYIADHFPSLVDLFNSIHNGRKSGKPESVLAFFITCPLAVLGCYIWYKFLEFINKKIKAEPDKIRSNHGDSPDIKNIR